MDNDKPSRKNKKQQKNTTKPLTGLPDQQQQQPNIFTRNTF
jgi:hypothetical protein